MATFIGIDGGGTKTSAVVANERGMILGEATAGPSNPNGSDMERIGDVFRSVKRQLTPYVGHWKRAVVFAGIAGVSHRDVHDALWRCLQNVFSDVQKLTLDHDGMNALASVTYGEPGVIQIAGTGSLTFGVGKQGTRCRIGGWGYLLGDEGSGFDLGRRALIQVMKAYDGRGRPTVLTDLVLKKWGLESPEDVIPYVYRHDVRRILASFTYELFQAAEDDDTVARSVIEEAAEELALSILTALESLDLLDEPVPVGLIGGAFQPLLIHALEKKLSGTAVHPSRLLRPQVKPVVGALAWAYKSAGLDPKLLLGKNEDCRTAH